MLIGGLWRLNERYVWTAMGEFRVKAAAPSLEKRFWDIFPSQCLRFWPLFLRRSRDIGFFLERTLPVLVFSHMTGFGTFDVDIKWLSPWIVVEWRGQVWCVSKEGRMWNVADEVLGADGLKIPKKPLWRISSSYSSSHSPSPPLPETPAEAGRDAYALPEGVFPSFFPIKVIEDFLTRFADESWFEYVEEIVLGRRAGADLFDLRFVRGRQKFTILIRQDKYGRHELDAALGQILGRLQREGGNYLIDATYEKKIVVRNLSFGAEEGSSK
jgi:hypothetical protein